MKKTIKLLRLLLIITSCLFFYSCTDSPAYFESASVTRTGGVAGDDNKTKSTKPTTYTNTSSKIKLLDGKYGTNGFIFMVEVPPNPGSVEDEYKGDWDTESCYMIVLVPYATGTAYKNPVSKIYSQSAYEKARAAFDAGKVKQ